MTRRLPIGLAFLFVAFLAQAQTLGPVDWIFLVDTSKSMRGAGKGSKDIFNDVKGSIDTFIDEANEGDTVTIYTFAGDVGPPSMMSISGMARDDLHGIVRELKAEGDRTHLGAAIAKGLDRAEKLRANADPHRKRAVVLFTDGRQDVRGIKDPIPITSNIARANDTYIFFVSMGEHDEQLDEFGKATAHTTILRPTPEAIRAVAQEIRAKIPAPSPPPPVVQTIPKPAPVLPPPPPPSPWMRALRWLIALAILGSIAFIAIRQRKKKNRLEGELEILRPQTAADAAFVGLPKLQTSEVVLSAILPLEVLNGSDARLFVKWKDRKKKVWIAAQSGALRINDVETPLSELYDADTIELGTAKFRFNRIGDERPYGFDSPNQEAL